jgi:hypothetical protein
MEFVPQDPETVTIYRLALVAQQDRLTQNRYIDRLQVMKMEMVQINKIIERYR